MLAAAGDQCAGCSNTVMLVPNRHIRLDTGDVKMLKTACCMACGLVAGIEQITVVDPHDRMRLLVGLRVGAEGDARSLQLADWGDQLLRAAESSISGCLVQAWEYLSRGQRQHAICTALGLKPGGAAAPPMVIGVPTIAIDNRVIAHILNDGGQNHVMYAPLLRTTLTDPLEVWQTDHDGHQNQVLFLRKFTQGSAEITYLAVGDADGEFLRTGYRLSGRGQAQGLRRGRLLFASWGF